MNKLKILLAVLAVTIFTGAKPTLDISSEKTLEKSLKQMQADSRTPAERKRFDEALTVISKYIYLTNQEKMDAMEKPQAVTFILANIGLRYGGMNAEQFIAASEKVKPELAKEKSKAIFRLIGKSLKK